MQRVAVKSTNAAATQQFGARSVVPSSQGASALRHAVPSGGIASIVATPETGGSGLAGAKVAASVPRVEWGPTEAELMVGYAQCAGGVE
jgi:hypothetical protein